MKKFNIVHCLLCCSTTICLGCIAPEKDIEVEVPENCTVVLKLSQPKPVIQIVDDSGRILKEIPLNDN